MSNANIVFSTDIHCNGEKSCAYSNIEAPTTVHGAGAYSLIYSTITAGAHNITLYLYGYYAGYGTQVTCTMEGVKCDIYCAFTGCYMLSCIGNCNWITAVTGSIEPFINANFTINETENIFSYYPSTTTALNDINCNLQPDEMTFDNFREEYNSVGPIPLLPNQDGPVCCRGDSSCRSGTDASITHSDSVICSGFYACQDITIDTPTNVFCEGIRSCERVNVMNAQNLYCMAPSACYNGAEYISVPNVICAASSSCGSLKLNSSGSDLHVYLLGYRSGRWMSIYCAESDHCNILCKGYESCNYMTVQ